MKSIFNGRTWSTNTRAGRLTAPTQAELTTLFEAVRAKASAILGRPAADAEVEKGIDRPPMTAAEQTAVRRAAALSQAALRIAKDAARSPEQARLEAARQRSDAERRAKLTASERELEDATAAANAAEQRRVDEAAREAIRQSPAYQHTMQQVRELTFLASYHLSITTGQLAALEGQLSALEQTADVPTVRSNLRTIQTAITGQLAVEAGKLKEAIDLAAKRRAAMSQGLVFDSIDTEVIGETEYVSLSVGSEVRKISKERFDARESDEALKASLFGGSTHGQSN